jgi:DNA-binding NtrC family response regulator
MPEILIIDCDDSYHDSLDESIERLGYKAAWVQNLSDGLERLSKRLFEVVLLQSRLPEGQSVDVLPRILEMPSAPEVIIFADSGDPDEAERTYFNRLFTSFVLKSEELDQLRDAARRILGQSKEYQRLIQDLR